MLASSMRVGLKFVLGMKVKLKTVSVKVSVASGKPLFKTICFSFTHLVATWNPYFWLKNAF